ncbi:unnamed protein product [Cuscuta europaea]|uniref:Transposase MuDR plant domain-containing protein n=1 Tax=Cuscuta europaea TaxID=41803 RepID=A0A9P1ECF4_CUSEU|nr:unnamed protein product [Cuscuta europaea]
MFSLSCAYFFLLLYICIFSLMDVVVFVMLKLDGSWSSDFTFNHTDTYVIHVRSLATYDSFIAMFTEMLLQYRPHHKFILSYFVEGSPHPVKINDESSFRFYLDLKLIEPDPYKFPLCVEFYSTNTLTIHSEEQHNPCYQSYISSGQSSSNIICQGTTSGKHCDFDFGDGVPFESLSSHSDLITSVVNGSTSHSEDNDTFSDESLPPSPKSDYSFHNLEVITYHHPTCIALHVIYMNKLELIYHLKMFAISNSFQYRTKTSKKHTLHVICLDPDCDWALRAVKLNGGQMFQIRRQGKYRQATYDVIANMVAHKFLDASINPYTPKQLMAEMSMDYGISMSYKKSWKAWKKAMEMQFGSDSESY